VRAVDAGIDLLYWGMMRRPAMARGIRDLFRAGRRDDVRLMIQSMNRAPGLTRRRLTSALRALGTDHAELFCLGWWQGDPWKGVLEQALRAREEGLCRYLAVSGHDRLFLGRVAADPESPFDLVMVRYNAAHVGAERETFPHCGGTRDAGVIAFTATRWGTLLRPLDTATPPLTAAQCYRFALAHPAVHVVLAGPKDGRQLEAALEAVAQGPLEGEELERVRTLGARYYRERPRRGLLG